MHKKYLMSAILSLVLIMPLPLCSMESPTDNSLTERGFGYPQTVDQLLQSALKDRTCQADVFEKFLIMIGCIGGDLLCIKDEKTRMKLAEELIISRVNQVNAYYKDVGLSREQQDARRASASQWLAEYRLFQNACHPRAVLSLLPDAKIAQYNDIVWIKEQNFSKARVKFAEVLIAQKQLFKVDLPKLPSDT